MFQRIADKLKTADPALVKSIGGIYEFAVMKNQSVKYWSKYNKILKYTAKSKASDGTFKTFFFILAMDLNNVVIYEGSPEDEEPDATFTLNEEVLLRIAKAEVPARVAVQSGKCSVTGNIMKAMKLEPYLKL